MSVLGGRSWRKQAKPAQLADQMQPGPRHQRGQALHQLQRAQYQMRGAIAPGRLQAQAHLAIAVQLDTLVGQCRAGDLATQSLETPPLMGINPHRRVQAETVDVRAQALARSVLTRGPPA